MVYHMVMFLPELQWVNHWVPIGFLCGTPNFARTCIGRSRWFGIGFGTCRWLPIRIALHVPHFGNDGSPVGYLSGFLCGTPDFARTCIGRYRWSPIGLTPWVPHFGLQWVTCWVPIGLLCKTLDVAWTCIGAPG
eukprot:1702562-Ditylum_brightwellii.AAC.1